MDEKPFPDLVCEVQNQNCSSIIQLNKNILFFSYYTHSTSLVDRGDITLITNTTDEIFNIRYYPQTTAEA